MGFSDTTTDVAYTIDLDRNYNVYRGTYKDWGINVDIHQIRVPADWRVRVERKGHAMLGGLSVSFRKTSIMTGSAAKAPS